MSALVDNFIYFSRPSIGAEEEQAALRVLRSGWLTTAKEAQSFETEFSTKTGATHSLAVNSATSGLILAMDACGIKTGTKILTTPYTFISTATSAIHLGGEIVYSDVEKDSYNLDPSLLEDKLKHDKTIKAIVPVHVAGNVCKMNEICQIAKKYNVYVIEDSAHAFPAPSKYGFAGTIGDVGVYSFYATKTITTAEGGMICTNNDELAKRMSIMRMHGINRTVWDRYTSKTASWQYDVVEAGYKFNMPDILAAIGREQLKKADSFWEKRKKIVAEYNKSFSLYDFLQLPPDSPGNSWHLYLLRIVPEKLSISRNEFADKLQESGIGISMHFIPHFHLSYIQNRYNLKETDFPNTEKCYNSTITIPLWPDMTDDMVHRVISTVIDIGKQYYAV